MKKKIEEMLNDDSFENLLALRRSLPNEIKSSELRITKLNEEIEKLLNSKLLIENELSDKLETAVESAKTEVELTKIILQIKSKEIELTQESANLAKFNEVNANLNSRILNIFWSSAQNTIDLFNARLKFLANQFNKEIKLMNSLDPNKFLLEVGKLRTGENFLDYLQSLANENRIGFSMNYTDATGRQFLENQFLLLLDNYIEGFDNEKQP